ncbi:Nn.00g059690.m01.CDS01 [Neocucurbitaria sp. VM-36]
MDDEAIHQTAGPGQEEEAIRVARHQETGRQRLEVQSSIGFMVANSRQIVVEALTRNVKEDHVREIFGKYGIIKDLRMPMNPTFNINRGIAYIIWMEPKSKSPLFYHDAVSHRHRHLRAELHHLETDTTTTMKDMEVAVVEEDGEEGRLAPTGHRRWMDRHAIDLHRVDGHRTEEDIGDGVEVDEEAAVGATGDVRIRGRGVARRDEVIRGLLIVDHHLGPHLGDEVGMAGEIVRPGEGEEVVVEVGAAEAEGAQAIVHMAVEALEIAA